LLCGWDIVEKPVSKQFKPTKAEKARCIELLKNVITQWEALKNTSVAGFQTSFLQRNGALSKSENGYLLRVEQKAWDVLLDRLPWSISMIKLSWMKTLLSVEWSPTS